MKFCKVWQSKIAFFAQHTLSGYFSTNREVNVELNEFEVTYECERVGEDWDILNKLFNELNQDDRPTAQIAHSLSVGDLIQIEDLYYLVKPFGFDTVQVNHY